MVIKVIAFIWVERLNLLMLNESSVSSIQPILQYIESNKITELLEDISTSQITVRIGKEIDDSLS